MAKYKIHLSLILSVIILYVTGNIFYTKLLELQSAQSSENYLIISIKLVDLIHELQIERGLSAGFIGDRMDIKLKAKVNLQRKKTNQAIDQLQAMLLKLDPDKEYWHQKKAFSLFFDKLQQFSTVRDKINLSGREGNYFDYYSDLNAMVIRLVEKNEIISTNPEIIRLNSVFTTVLWLTERAGQERGVINGVFKSHQISAINLRQISSYISEQDNLFRRFDTISTTEEKQLMEKKLSVPVVKKVEELRLAVMNQSVKKDLLNKINMLIGYGGLIHDFKNYLIRGKAHYSQRFEFIIQELKILMNKYASLSGTSDEERVYLNTIIKTFEKYGVKLTEISEKYNTGMQIADIDQMVSINDNPALQALLHLHNDITHLDTESWFKYATQRMNLIENVGMLNRKKILQQSGKNVRDIENSLLLTSLITVTIFSLLLALITYTIRHDILTQKAIKEISITDGLTGIYNRRHFDEVFPQTLSIAKRNKSNLVFILMDIDFFKRYNDSYGHQDGDKAIKAVARALKKSLNRADDYVFRLGGEEFGMLFSAKNLGDSKKFANSVRLEIEGLCIEHQKNVASNYLTVSMGLYYIDPLSSSEIEQIYKKTDHALYEAKKSGRNRVIVFKD